MKNDAIITIKVIPLSAKNAFISWENQVLRIKLKAAPEKGEANDALLAFLKEFLHIPLSRMHLLKGKKSRIKTVKIDQLSCEEFDQIMQKKAEENEN